MSEIVFNGWDVVFFATGGFLGGFGVCAWVMNILLGGVEIVRRRPNQEQRR